jgi:DNA-binding CsgD family transcriptional regulator
MVERTPRFSLVAGDAHHFSWEWIHMELRPQEREVLQAFAQGMSTDEVAEHLAINVHTVRAHLKNAMPALGAHSKLEAIIRAGQAGLITLPGWPGHPEQRGPPPSWYRQAPAGLHAPPPAPQRPRCTPSSAGPVWSAGRRAG